LTKKQKKFHKAWWFLNEHPLFMYPEEKRIMGEHASPRFMDCLDVDFQLVDPKTRRISDNKKKNTRLECWLECGGVEENTPGDPNTLMHCHDLKLDCGGETFEEAIIKLAKLVKKHYKNKGKDDV
jgi:hypothetical protein